MNEHFDLDKTLLSLGSEAGQSLTIRQAVEGIFITGGIGSGKSTGSARMLAIKLLNAGFGGLVLTVKASEKMDWIRYCAQTGRSKDLIIVEPKGQHTFNFLDYEATRSEGGAFTENIAQVLKTVIRAGEEKASGKSDDAFWEAALDLLIFNAIDLCQLAYGSVSLRLLYDLVKKAPRSIDEEQRKQKERENAGGDTTAGKARQHNAFDKAFDLATKCVNNLTDAWLETLTEQESERILKSGTLKTAAAEAVPQARLLDLVGEFFYGTYLNLAEKTRSIVDISFSSFLYRLMREPVFSMFGKGQSTFTPEDSLDGKIILLNLPVKQYNKVGRDCQILFKYIWQRAMEARQVENNARPVFLWADEAQHFIHEHDAEFQATARSSRIATVYITQNLPNLYANMGGAKSEYRVKSFLGTLGTKIFHANADVETNHYASDLIGSDYALNKSQNFGYGEQASAGINYSLTLEKLVRPEFFISLKTGGPANRYVVEGVLHRQGSPVAEGRNHCVLSFDQHFTL